VKYRLIQSRPEITEELTSELSKKGAPLLCSPTKQPPGGGHLGRAKSRSETPALDKRDAEGLRQSRPALAKEAAASISSGEHNEASSSLSWTTTLERAGRKRDCESDLLEPFSPDVRYHLTRIIMGLPVVMRGVPVPI
jgi:hypothetical protein